MEEINKLKEYLNYDANTGIFTWIKVTSRTRGNLIGKIAGGKCGQYVRITALGKEYLAHRLAWFFVYGNVPKIIDHINGNGYDNRISNLRDANHSINARNQSIHRHGKLPYVDKRPNGKFRGKIQIESEQITIGTFDTDKEAFASVYGYLFAKGLIDKYML